MIQYERIDEALEELRRELAKLPEQSESEEEEDCETDNSEELDTEASLDDEEEEEMTEREVCYSLEGAHFIASTPCPYSRAIHRGTLTQTIRVGSVSCDQCRWFCSKDVASRVVRCRIPKRLADKYLREHRKHLRRAINYIEAIKINEVSDSTVKRKLNLAKDRKTLTKTPNRNRAKGQGSIALELHNHGHNKRNSYRWVATIMHEGKRYRLRSYNFEKCYAWLQAIREELSILNRQKASL